MPPIFREVDRKGSITGEQKLRALLSQSGFSPGPLPRPTGYQNGEPYWSRAVIVDYCKDALRVRPAGDIVTR